MIQIQKTLSEKYMSGGLDKMASDVIEILKWIAHSNNSCWAEGNGAAKAIDTIRKKSEDVNNLDEIMRRFGYCVYRCGIYITYHISGISSSQVKQLSSLDEFFSNIIFVREIENIRVEGNCANRARRILRSLYRYFTSIDENDYSDLDKMSLGYSRPFVESPR